MRPRPLVLALLSLVFVLPSCSDTDKPSQLLTSPGDAQHDVDFWRENNCPVIAYSHTMNIEEDEYKPQITLSALGLNDADEDDTHSITVTQGPSHGFTGPGDSPYTGGYVYYMPDRNFCGTDELKVKVSDGICESNECTVTINVSCENDCPKAYSDGIGVNPGGSVNFQLDAIDDDDDPLQYTVVSPPTHGTVVVQTQTGAASYTPSAGYCGADGFTFKVNDGQCDSDVATITISMSCAPPDADGDGVPDDQDDCDDSDIGATVKVGTCDTGVANDLGSDGCTLSDKITSATQAASQNAANHGKFVSAMAKALNTMVANGSITADEKDAIMHCVGSSDVSKH
jgi:Bacterial Ig domain